MQSSLPKSLRSILKQRLGFLFVYCLFSFFNATAQNPEINEVNLQLRAYFESLSKPAPTKAFFV